MILQALTDYYEVLEKEGEIARPGWARTRVSYALELDEDGQLIRVYSLKTETQVGKKLQMRPRGMNLPAPVKKTVNVASNFLWDNASYLLGMNTGGRPERTRRCFEAAGRLHKDILGDLDDPFARAVCPAVKGVRGAQSSGAALVSFNAPAFCSYGREQNLNAPVGKYASFAYTAALNHLLADRGHVKRFSDTTLVYWAENAEPEYQDAFAVCLGGEDESALTGQELDDFIKSISRMVLNLADKHMKKLEGGMRTYYAKQLGGLMERITEGYPAHHNLYDQGIFQLGYYHQTQKRFEKKDQTSAADNTDEMKGEEEHVQAYQKPL